jgi:hypothetical protein
MAPLPGRCQGNKGCPWLNVATATGVLRSSETSPMATLAQGSPALCSFQYRDATASRELRITVEQAQAPGQLMKAREGACGSSTAPLKAIGNEAVACKLGAEGSTTGELIIGRVRDQIFTVSVTGAANDRGVIAEAMGDKTRNIAEQVAGALF